VSGRPWLDFFGNRGAEEVAPFTLEGNPMKRLLAILVACSLFILCLTLLARDDPGQQAKDDEAPGEITRLGGHRGEVLAVAFAHDGKSAVSYGNDFALRR
jgi:hypothetical protein